MPRQIDRITIHRTGTPNGLWIDVECIDHWHATRGFRREPGWIDQHEPRLRHIGYHWVIYTSGSIRAGRHPDEADEACGRLTERSLSVCLVGRNAFTREQWSSLAVLVRALREEHPMAVVAEPPRCVIPGAGCPGFSVADWLANACQPLPDHLFTFAPSGCCGGVARAEEA